MIIALGTDHTGVKFKQNIIEFLNSLNHKVIDCGTFTEESCDYPEIASVVAKYVSDEKCDKGILLCGTGIGMSIVANKFPKIRAALCYGDEIAKLAKQHNNANILCLPARFCKIEDMFKWISIWLETPFSNEERHIRRINKINEIEKQILR